MALRKDYDCDIMYHGRKANMVADSLIRMMTSTRIQDLFMRMTVVTPLLEIIKGVRVRSIKEENRKREMVVGQVLTFDNDSWCLLNTSSRVWVPYSVEV